MIKKYVLLGFLVFFMVLGLQAGVNAENPNLPKAPEWEFGEISAITKSMPSLSIPHNMSNIDPKYDNQKVINSWGYKAKPWSEIQDLLPEAFYNVLIHPEVWGTFRINESAYIPRTGKAHALYMKDTEKYKGEPYLDEDNWLRNYKSGIPFPEVNDNDPQLAVKCAWNFMKRGKGGGDRTYDSFITMIDRNGRTKFVDSSKDRMYFFGRLHHDPKPVYQPNPKNLECMVYSANKLPYNVAGTIALFHRYDIPGRDDDMWVYVPSMRRVRRMSTAERQDKMSGGKDFIWDNVETFDGQISNYNFELLETKTMLLPLCCSNVPSNVKGGFLCGVDDFWQRRKTYVIKATPRKQINISEMILYMDAEEFMSNIGVVKDSRGRDWIVSFYSNNRGADGELLIYHGSSIDLITRHASKNFNVNVEFANKYEPGMFSMEELKRKFLVR